MRIVETRAKGHKLKTQTNNENILIFKDLLTNTRYYVVDYNKDVLIRIKG